MEFCYNNFGIELLDDDVLLLRGPLRLCPAHLSLHLLQQGGQQLINWLKRLGVAFLCQRHVVKHVMMRNGAVNLNKASVDIDQLHPAVALHVLSQDGVHSTVSFSQGGVRASAG